MANANPAAALDQSMLEGRLSGMQVDLADIKELLRVLVARSNGADDGRLTTAPPAMIPPAKRQKTREEEFEEYLRQKEQAQAMES